MLPCFRFENRVDFGRGGRAGPPRGHSTLFLQAGRFFAPGAPERRRGRAAEGPVLAWLPPRVRIFAGGLNFADWVDDKGGNGSPVRERGLW